MPAQEREAWPRERCPTGTRKSLVLRLLASPSGMSGVVILHHLRDGVTTLVWWAPSSDLSSRRSSWQEYRRRRGRAISPSPSEAMAPFVREGLSPCRFGTCIAGGRYTACRGKLILYFIEQDGECKVLGSAGSFYVGQRFAIKRHRSMPQQRSS